MIVKPNKDKLHEKHLTNVFKRVQNLNMRLNPKKCTSGIKDRNFLGFHLIEMGIEANRDKHEEIIEMEIV